MLDERTKIVRDQLLQGPLRIFPGRLSVSRALGDIEAKRRKYGGNQDVLISQPDIKSFRVDDKHDFVLLACDGIFDKLTDSKVIKAVWQAARKRFQSEDQIIHPLAGAAVEMVLKLSVSEKTADNITVVIVCFRNFQR